MTPFIIPETSRWVEMVEEKYEKVTRCVALQQHQQTSRWASAAYNPTPDKVSERRFFNHSWKYLTLIKPSIKFEIKHFFKENVLK